MSYDDENDVGALKKVLQEQIATCIVKEMAKKTELPKGLVWNRTHITDLWDTSFAARCAMKYKGIKINYWASINIPKFYDINSSKPHRGIKGLPLPSFINNLDVVLTGLKLDKCISIKEIEVHRSEDGKFAAFYLSHNTDKTHKSQTSYIDLANHAAVVKDIERHAGYVANSKTVADARQAEKLLDKQFVEIVARSFNLKPSYIKSRVEWDYKRGAREYLVKDNRVVGMLLSIKDFHGWITEGNLHDVMEHIERRNAVTKALAVYKKKPTIEEAAK